MDTQRQIDESRAYLEALAGLSGEPDVRVVTLGSVVTLEPCTDRGRAWLAAETDAAAWQWIGGRLAVEPRTVGALVDGLRADGLVVVEGRA